MFSEIVPERSAAGKFLVPLIHQRPVHGTGAEIRQMLVLLQPVDRLLDHGRILAKRRAVTRQQPLHVAALNPSQRFDECRDVRAVVRIDIADGPIAINVIPREQEIPQSKGQLRRRVTGSMPDLEIQSADLEDIPFVDLLIELDRRKIERDALRIDELVQRGECDSDTSALIILKRG